MRLKRVHIKGYRSLKDVELTLDDFQVLVGPNASGKTNVFKALQFLSNVYTDDLDTAIRKDGGFESIYNKKKYEDVAFGEISFKIELKGLTKLHKNAHESSIRQVHSFTIAKKDSRTIGEYKILNECLIIEIDNKELVISVTTDNKVNIKNELDLKYIEESFPLFLLNKQLNEFKNINSHGLFTTLSKHFVLYLHPLFLGESRNMPMKWNYFNISSHISRGSYAASNFVTVESSGAGIASLVLSLQSSQQQSWNSIMGVLQEIIPELENITVDINSNKQAEILFEFSGLTEKLTAMDVSDGTILLLTTLCVISEKHSSVVCIDEPENSLHPWAIDELIKFCREQAQHKTIMLATQSLQVIDALYPKEILCVYRENQATSVSKLTDLVEGITEDWEAGNVVLSQVFTSGLVPQTVPKF